MVLLRTNDKGNTQQNLYSHCEKVDHFAFLQNKYIHRLYCLMPVENLDHSFKLFSSKDINQGVRRTGGQDVLL